MVLPVKLKKSFFSRHFSLFLQLSEVLLTNLSQIFMVLSAKVRKKFFQSRHFSWFFQLSEVLLTKVSKIFMVLTAKVKKSFSKSTFFMVLPQIENTSLLAWAKFSRFFQLRSEKHLRKYSNYFWTHNSSKNHEK